MFTSLLIGVWKLALLTFKLVRFERIESEPADDPRLVEMGLAVGAVVVIFQPLFYAFSAEKGITSTIAALLGLLDRLMANETLEEFVKFA